MNSTTSPPTTHADRIAGWIVIGLFVAACLAMGFASFVPGIDPSSRAQLLSIAGMAIGAMAGSLQTSRRSAPLPDTAQQITIPSSDGGPVTIQSSSGGGAVVPSVVTVPTVAGIIPADVPASPAGSDGPP